jgi:hypothetical protein
VSSVQISGKPLLLPSRRSRRFQPPPPIPQLAFQRTYAIQSRGWLTEIVPSYQCHQWWVFAFPITAVLGGSAGYWGFSILAITQFWQFRRSVFSHPPGLFLTFVANKALPPFDAWASLASRLGGPWATLGPPKGHPIPNPVEFVLRTGLAKG